jgi:hypothetical protein
MKLSGSAEAYSPNSGGAATPLSCFGTIVNERATFFAMSEDHGPIDHHCQFASPQTRVIAAEVAEDLRRPRFNHLGCDLD